ncbi:senecionine N-oxygenase-like [Diachasmimorpha longicaudata]|uniref:senecionine N-oxygenase-like n=1 Tax=Diachasmimorpha longicaudata TaxID=58733 RepID=UPI0030B890F2
MKTAKMFAILIIIFTLVFCSISFMIMLAHMRPDRTRVAIIGGGLCGLIATKHLGSKPQKFDLTVFERNREVGGMWVYTELTGLDSYGLPVHSGLYKNLKTNVPKEIMTMPDFPFPKVTGPSYVHHSVIKKYLQNYTRHFGLYRHIKLNTLVTYVEPNTSWRGKTTYRVSHKNLLTDTVESSDFDAVIISNGHLTIGKIPEINGSDTFPGTAIHSHDYRHPEYYSGRTVCILGLGESGFDIAFDLSPHVTKIYLSHNKGDVTLQMPKNIELRAGLISINGNTLTFDDDTTAEVDDIIYCTGYKFTYPFLSDRIELSTADNHVEPLYKHLIHTEMPNLFFMGLPDTSFNIPLAYIQSQYIMGLLEGRLELPSPMEMRTNMLEEKLKLLDDGFPVRYILKFLNDGWKYYDGLAALAKVPAFPVVLKKIFNHMMLMVAVNLQTFKNYRYEIVNPKKFRVQYISPVKSRQ